MGNKTLVNNIRCSHFIKKDKRANVCSATWCSMNKYNIKKYVGEDNKIRQVFADILSKLLNYNLIKPIHISRIDTDSKISSIQITVYTENTLLIRKNLDTINQKLKNVFKKNFVIIVENIKKVYLYAGFACNAIIDSLQNDNNKHSEYKRIVRSVMKRSIKAGALGIFIKVKGRIHGISRAKVDKHTTLSIKRGSFDSNLSEFSRVCQKSYGTINISIIIRQPDTM